MWFEVMLGVLAAVVVLVLGVAFLAWLFGTENGQLTILVGIVVAVILLLRWAGSG